MRAPKLRLAPFWIAVALNVVLVVALVAALFHQRMRTDHGESHAAPAAAVVPAKVEPEVTRQVTRQRHRLFFRVVDADGEKEPIGLARVAIVNGNLAPELGDDSDAVTWSDGRAVISRGGT
jgi:hypothetical protein